MSCVFNRQLSLVCGRYVISSTHACVGLKFLLLRASSQRTDPKSSLEYSAAINVCQTAVRCKILNYYWSRLGVISVSHERSSHGLICAIFAFHSLDVGAKCLEFLLSM
jgi:hypothetical protein